MPVSKRQVLRGTDVPGVFRNNAGVLVNVKGIALSFADVKAADAERWTEVLGSVPKTPAELLKGVALDPRLSLDTRINAARQAAPYYDMRMPLRVDGSFKTPGAIDMVKLAAMPKKDREALLLLLKAAGAEL